MKKQIFAVKDVKPSQDNLKVLGVFNPGAALFDGKTVLLLRVAETCAEQKEGKIIIPLMGVDGLAFKEFDISNKAYDFSDSRVIKCVDGSDRNYLTSLSHFRLAWSDDGINFEVSDIPTIMSEGPYEEYGIEDPRINKVDGRYLITCSCVSRYGIVAGLIETNDFKTFERKGYIFHPDNKDVVIFPRKINGLYYALHRPSTSEFGDLSMWLASSSDLLRFGNHAHLLSPFKGTDRFDNYRIGSSCQPIEIDGGYLEIYHGANKQNQYKVGAMLIDKNDPRKITKICKKPILEPTMDFEKKGFVKDVVFACGATLDGDELKVYYGASDDATGVATLSLHSIIQEMEEFKE
jgi:beta-1,2-mannobiose phosphorylase / 1,2-beta-oligomannan phosphorylase